MSGSSPVRAPPAAMPQMVGQRPIGGALVPDFFANQIRLGATLTDFTLVFGVAIEGGESGQAGILDRAAIHLAPGSLKQLLLTVTMAVEAYEEAVAPIRVPQRLPASLGKFKTDLVSMLRQQMEGSPTT